ncbi:hypothetical protein BD410DRAFT_846742 [Rickenella mellea]|uniref:Uncharacterized protein n=1 Tax=Rickenella mellea TaxID=50990 RepID=A0A4Y7PE47_9AGAM|nr:hypothetical protein BD410DRAFT_846742 [Rickenella mellea]
MVRKTRSGAEFSPWADAVSPILLPPEIDVDALVDRALQEDARREEESDFKDDLQLEDPLAPSTAFETPTTTPSAANPTPSRDKRRSKARRKGKREAEDDPSHTNVKKIALKRVAESNPLHTSLITDELRVASSGWVGLRRRKEIREKRLYSLEEMLRPSSGFMLIEWDGLTPRPIVDGKDRVVAVLVGRPRDPGWAALSNDVFTTISKARDRCTFSQDQADHRRGQFPTLSIGTSFGGGQCRAGNLASTPANKTVLEELLKEKCIQRIANFAARSFAAFAPRLYEYYAMTIDTLFKSDTSLRQNFPNNPLPCTAINFGPQVQCLPHFDIANLPFGWCTISAFGHFDPVRGGHIVLWDLGLVIQFPPGSTIDIPSAIFEHSNVTIAENETRISFTQYAAGGLFRWVANGMQTDKQLAASDPEKKRELDRAKAGRWERGLSMFSTLTELLA